jgi:hypothetical protein
MISVANHAPIPFFDRIPIRARLAIRRACDLACLPTQNPEAVYAILCADLKLIGVEQPGRAEFAIWFDGVKAEAAMEDSLVASVIDDLKCSRPRSLAVVETTQPVNLVSGITHAQAVVKAADALFKAKLAAGYSPISSAVANSTSGQRSTLLTEWSAWLLRMRGELSKMPI